MLEILNEPGLGIGKSLNLIQNLIGNIPYDDVRKKLAELHLRRPKIWSVLECSIKLIARLFICKSNDVSLERQLNSLRYLL